MAFSYSQNIQNRIAIELFGVQYSSLDTVQKIGIDGNWTTGSLSTGAAFDALTYIAQIANNFEMAGSTSAPQVWESWLVAKTAYELAPTYRPDRTGMLRDKMEVAIDGFLDAYTRIDPTGTFASSNISQTTDVNGIRAYVINHCARRKESGVNTGMRRRLFIPVDTIDSHIQWVLNFIYNKEPWNFRKREVSVIIRVVTGITGLTWNESGKTLTGTGAFTNMLTLSGRHARFLVTSGTGVLLSEVQIASRDSNDQITLKQSILPSGETSNPTDVAGQLFTIELRGTLPSESFDSIASRKLYYQGDSSSSAWGGSDAWMSWMDASDMARLKARYASGSGQPVAFRTELQPSDVVAWHLAPFPDATYNLRGAVFITGPGTPSSATDTTIFSKFPSEFFTVIRDMVLARVLLENAASDAERVWGRAVDHVERLLPIYTDQGDAQRITAPLDVYQDQSRMWGTGFGWPAGLGDGGSGGLL